MAQHVLQAQRDLDTTDAAVPGYVPCADVPTVVGLSRVGMGLVIDGLADGPAPTVELRALDARVPTRSRLDAGARRPSPGSAATSW